MNTSAIPNNSKYEYSSSDWIEEIWGKINTKMEWVSEKNKDIIPYTTDAHGNYIDIYNDIPCMWTNGFWCGIMWLMYSGTNNSMYKSIAEQNEKKLDKILFADEQCVEKLDHDTGFLWIPSALTSYRLTNNLESRKRALLAANTLAARYNPAGEFLTAWNGTDRQGWSIVDTMMNLPLLYWASEEFNVERYRQAAKKHAFKSMNHIVRSDGSCNHIVSYEISSGDFIKAIAGQGSEDNSSWTRGQGWALYGFSLSYRYTKEPLYLNTAMKVADYVMGELRRFNYLPPSDFRGDNTGLIDSSAGGIMASGFLELAAHVPSDKKKLYIDCALNILKSIEKECCDWSHDSDAIVKRSCERYEDAKEKTIIYADYFFIEAILKLRGVIKNMW